MTHAPLVVFDVNGTLSDLDALPQHFEEVGALPQFSEQWFAVLLRDAFALTVTGDNPVFEDLARNALHEVLAGEVLNRNLEDAVEHILTSLQELPVHDDVPPGIRELRSAGLDVAALTNGAASSARSLLERADVAGEFTAVLSVEDAPRWKPAPEAYAYAVEALQRDASELVLVAVHPWDVSGAARAGLRTVWLNRSQAPYPAAMTPPDHEVTTLTGLAAILAP